jgi:hypothetical protein
MVNPASTALNGTIPVNFSVVVTTTARGSAAPLGLKMRPWTPGLYPSLLAWTVLMLLLALRFSTGKLRRPVALASSVLMLVMLIASCGGGGGAPPPPQPQTGTPAGTSTLVVTATSGSATRTFNLTLVVR